MQHDPDQHRGRHPTARAPGTHRSRCAAQHGPDVSAAAARPRRAGGSQADDRARPRGVGRRVRLERRHARGCSDAATRSSHPPTRSAGCRPTPPTCRSVLATIAGPIVLVGHSYGGMVMTNAADGQPERRARSSTSPPSRQTSATPSADSGAMNPGSELGPDNARLPPAPGRLDVYIDPAAFRDVFAAGSRRADAAALMAAEPRPIDAARLGAALRSAGLAHDPFLVPRRQTGPRHPARHAALHGGSAPARPPSRSGPPTPSMISRPGAVSDVILDAVQASS